MTSSQRKNRLLSRLRPRTLRLQALFYLLVPTFILLVGMSVAGFFIVRNVLVNQWGQTAVATLQQTAHLVDMKLHGSKELLRLLQASNFVSEHREFFDTVVQRLLDLDSVLEVRIDWPKTAGIGPVAGHMGRGGRHQFHLDRFKTSNPIFDEETSGQVITLVSKFIDDGDVTVGQLEIVFSFDVLVAQIQAAKWWQSNRAYLINSDGEVLASASETDDLEHQFPRRYFGGLGKLERQTLAALKANTSGTVFSEGMPPSEVSGFYRLQEMPWSVVVISPGEIILQPLIRLRNLYSMCFAASIVLILLFILRATGGVTLRIERISRAAGELAAGRFGPPLPETENDEVGDLTSNFNRMSAQLKQRLSMKKAINVAREVQQNLLPEQVFQENGVGIAGMSRYCDETGGDYYDLLTFKERDTRVGVALGDVVGHGIGAALLMTTIRALLRCRLAIGGGVAETISDVNRLLCLDTSKSGSFITLLYLEVDVETKQLQWVRAGHEPALMYLPQLDTFEELRGEGIALGVDENWIFDENSIDLSEQEAIICLATDGVFELENEDGEQFGKNRLKTAIEQHQGKGPQAIVAELLAELDQFRGQCPQRDDITLVVMKVGTDDESSGVTF